MVSKTFTSNPIVSNSYQTILKKLIPRFLMLAVLVVVFNQVYLRYFWENDLENHAQVLLPVLKCQDTADAIYFGESSNFSYHPTRDTSKLRISDYINNHFPTKYVATVNNSAYHSGIYLPLIQQIKPNSGVEVVIVTLNMRTFDQAAIHSSLESALQKSAVMYYPRPPLLNRTLLTLNFYDDKSAIERDYLMWQSWTYDTLKSTNPNIVFEPNTIRRWCETDKFLFDTGGYDKAKRELADHNIKAFAFKITEENPRVKSFDEIVNVADNKGFKLVFNLMAENVEYADSLVGQNLVWLMRQNRDFLVERYTKRGVVVVDNLEDVPGYHYTDQHWTTEHYDETGRRIIAKNVADSIRNNFNW